jgi:hypothetical protein
LRSLPRSCAQKALSAAGRQGNARRSAPRRCRRHALAPPQAAPRACAARISACGNEHRGAAAAHAHPASPPKKGGRKPCGAPMPGIGPYPGIMLHRHNTGVVSAEPRVCRGVAEAALRTPCVPCTLAVA